MEVRGSLALHPGMERDAPEGEVMKSARPRRDVVHSV